MQKLDAPFRAFCIFPVGFILKTCGQFQQGFSIFTLEAKATTNRAKKQMQQALQRQAEKQQQVQQRAQPMFSPRAPTAEEIRYGGPVGTCSEYEYGYRHGRAITNNEVTL